MKIVFTQSELSWLNNYVKVFLGLAAKHRDEDKGRMLRLAGKMKHKFTPNASYVWLSLKERDLLYNIAETRLRAVQDTLSPEREVAGSIIDKLVEEKTT